ncbi:MAG TPA: PorV/PorQ family protein, partial [bacterium]|nr:PorV/PorQ family protein [bacterium]
MNRRSALPGGLAALALLLATSLRADGPAVGTTSANFLKLGSDARSEAMGEAYVALADDAGGLEYNPSGMLSLPQSELQLTHTTWFGGVYFERMDLVDLVSPDEAVGVGLSYVSLPQQDATVADSSNPLGFDDTGTFNPYNLAASAALAWQMGWGIRAGALLDITSQSYDGKSAMGVGFDLGLQRDLFIEDLQGGFAVQNIGPSIPLVDKSFGLPMVIRAGLSYNFWHRALMSLDVDVPNDNSLVVAAGLEVPINDSFCLRGGYRMDGIFNPMSAGFGFKLPVADLDASWVPMGELGQTFRLSLGVKWGGWIPAGQDIALQGVQTLMLNNSSPDYAEIRLQPLMRRPDDAKDWTLFVYGGSPAHVVWKYPGSGPFHGSLSWGGVSDAGAPVPGGTYQAVLAIRMKSGGIRYSNYVAVVVNPPLPQPLLGIDPESLDPAQPNQVFVATKFTVAAPGPAATMPLRWRLTILDANNNEFQRQEGSLQDNPVWVWTGTNSKGQEFASNSDYHFVLSLIDNLGNVLVSAPPLT